MRVLSTLAIRAGLLVVTLPKCAKWLIGDSFLFRSEMCESRSPQGERGRRVRVCRLNFSGTCARMHRRWNAADGGPEEGSLNVQHLAKATQIVTRERSHETLIDHIAQPIRAAKAAERPFAHLEFDRIFPDDVYAAMLHALPVAADYRPMSGRSKGSNRPDGAPTRVKIDLFPEYIRHLPADKRRAWHLVGRALCSRPVQAAFVERLAPGLEARFGKHFAGVDFYPIPILTPDNPGYRLAP